MSRLQQARFLALTDGYWRGYVDGLDDKYDIRDPEPQPARVESWDSEWTATPQTPAPVQD